MMNESTQEKSPSTSMLEAWMSSAAEYWKTVGRMMTEALSSAPEQPDSEERVSHRAQASMATTLKTWHSLSEAITQPGELQSLLKSMQTLPDVFMKAMGAGWDGFFQLQQQWLDKQMQRGESSEGYSLESLDRDAFKSLRVFYEKEIRQFLHMPQLGLTRFYQERVAQMVDKFNVFQIALGEFINLFLMPVEKSFRVMQEEIAKMAEGGPLPQTTKEYYQMWIKILEGRYMTLFKSPEYTEAMGHALNALEDYLQAREEVMADVLKAHSIPSNKDIDELAREIYHLKRKLRRLESKSAPK